MILIKTAKIIVSLSIFLFLINFASNLHLNQSGNQKELKSPLVGTIEAYQVPKTTQQVEASTPSAELSKKSVYSAIGRISYYSHAGCLGCSENQTMGNGEAFDENDMTIAVPCKHVIRPAKVRYNTRVLVTNLDNGKSVEAKITDCGGFSKYNRVADLSKGVYQAIEAKTDVSTIEIRAI